MNADNGIILVDLPFGADVDATKFDGKQAFASCRDGKLEVVSETAPGKFEIVQTVETPESARTMTIDPSTEKIFLPTAEMEPAQAGARPRPKPGTFRVVVVSRTGKNRY